MRKKYKISIINYNESGFPISGISRIISNLSFTKVRNFQDQYPGRVDLKRKLDIKEI
tara:strand:+ start:126 stop:296 length:171 start_codon:yes stop_codon:yes gene_type:complete